MNALDQATATEVASLDEDFADLLAVLEEVEASQKAAKTLKDKRIELAKTADDPALQDMLLREIQELELARSYVGISVVARVIRVQCACGSHYKRLDGFFYHSMHKTNKTERWSRCNSNSREHLPREVRVEHEEVIACMDCLNQLGF